MTEVDAEMGALRAQRNHALDEMARLIARLHSTNERLAAAQAEIAELKSNSNQSGQMK